MVKSKISKSCKINSKENTFFRKFQSPTNNINVNFTKQTNNQTLENEIDKCLFEDEMLV